MEVTSPERKVHNGSRRSLVAQIGLLALFAAGLILSLRTTFAVYRLDSDLSQSAMLWFGVQKEGWAFITQWRYTADDWLFSWNLLHFALFRLLGTDPRYVLFSGWLVFVGNALAAGGLAHALGARKSAFILPGLLLFAGAYAHRAGLSAYPMSHSITNLFGLLMALWGIGWVRNRHVSALAALTLCGLLGGISDPWLLAPYVFPLALGALAGGVFGARENRRAYGALFLSMVAVTAAVKTRGFGLLDFLPVFDFRLADWNGIRANADAFWQCLGGLFCGTFPVNPAAAAVALVALGLLGSGAVWFLWKERAGGSLAWLIPVSLGGISAALVLSRVSAGETSGRFLVNWLYLAPVFVAVALEGGWRRVPVGFRAFAVACALAFAATGIATTAPYWRAGNADAANAGRVAMEKFLGKNGLNYGYGPYWGSLSNAVTWATGERLVIRPVNFSPETGGMITARRLQSDAFWYRPGDAPAGQKKYFVLLKADGEQCANTPLCIRGLTRQFGPPAQTLHHEDATVLVWDHPLIDFPRAIEPGQPMRLTKTEPPMPWRGWDDPGERGTWACGPVAELKLQARNLLAGEPKPLKLTFEARCKQPMALLFINGLDFGTLHFSGNQPETFTIGIPPELAPDGDGQLVVQFRKPPTRHSTRKPWLCLSTVRIDPGE
ncbi:MAG: hypothetical protein ACFUZC_15720 [Chthoniobacteraceae bacterium]